MVEPKLRSTRSVFLAVGVLAFALGLVGAKAISGELEDSTPCPTLPRHTAPSEIHLVPGILPHNSWVVAPAMPGEAGVNVYVLCRDGHFEGLAYGPPADDYVRFGVSTTWVDAQWLRGQLDSFYAKDRWDVAPLSCAPTDKGYAACS